MSDIRQRLLVGIERLNLEIPVLDLAEKLEAYLILLHKWNQAYNLTAVRDIQSMVGRHILDSLAVLPWLQAPRIIDVGTGAGLPGIPLALARPDLQIVLLDSNGKKTRFLLEVKRVLNLQHVEIIQSRVEDYNPPQGFDTVVSRAFTNINDMLHWTDHLIAKQGIWLAMKGLNPDHELLNINHPYRIEPYVVAGVDGKRCCVIISETE
ncbi:MAG: 16S rRNA (guanine(527)-N(7))-methyltransferase RsmG [Legionellaceae bacterium]|nr:16S rRNA (guanine(527)-N(7))-methyltransferase RsmG [Legionellaceae bacterium]